MKLKHYSNSRKDFDGIINVAAFTHTSVAIRDALNILKTGYRITYQIFKREEFRQKSLISDIVTVEFLD